MSTNFDQLFAEFNRPHSPGIVAMLISDGRIIFEHGYGLANLETETPCSTTTTFRLASVTKQFTAMAILILAHRNQLGLEEPFTAFFPEFPEYGKAITVRHLLTHSSGLLDYEDLIPKGTELPVLDRDALRLLMQVNKTYFPPGTSYRYSNSGFALLAQIVEVRSGKTFAHFLHDNIFEPLQMRSTMAYEQGLRVVPERAFGYSPAGSSFKRTDQSLTSSVLGDGGVYSSVEDLFKWDQALYTSKLVPHELLRDAFKTQVATDKPGIGYGFGWFVGSYRELKEVWHSGNTVGFTTRIIRYPEKHFTVILLANRNEAELAEIPHKIADQVLFGGH